VGYPGERRREAPAGRRGGAAASAGPVARLHEFQGEHPGVQFTSPVMGRYGQYTALVPPDAIPGESREIVVTSLDLYVLIDELDGLFGLPGTGLNRQRGNDYLCQARRLVTGHRAPSTGYRRATNAERIPVYLGSGWLAISDCRLTP